MPPKKVERKRRPGRFASEKRPPPPRHLSVESKGVWTRVHHDHNIDDEAGKVVFVVTLEGLDRLRSAQARLKRDGIVVTDRFGKLKAHPACAIERDARAQVLAGFKQLGLELDEKTLRRDTPDARFLAERFGIGGRRK